MKSNDLYIHLYNGRERPFHNTPSINPLNGPLIGPIGITMIFGELHLHCPDYADSAPMVYFSKDINFFLYDDRYYSDLEILTHDDPDLRLMIQDPDQAVHDFEVFKLHRTVAALQQEVEFLREKKPRII